MALAAAPCDTARPMRAPSLCLAAVAAAAVFAAAPAVAAPGPAHRAPVTTAAAAGPPGTRACAVQRLPARAAPTGPRAAAVSNIIFLNDCTLPGSCDLTPGGELNDSRTNTSSVAQQPTTMAPWRFTTAEWDELVQCVRRVYQPFPVQIVTEEPPATAEYFEAMVAGSAAQLGLGGGIVGVAPFDCGVLPNGISFSFANDYGNLNPSNAADLCWTVAHEVAHLFGLQHKFDSRDPMTYLPPPLPQKLFLDEAGPCGAGGVRDCKSADAFEAGCPDGPSTINSYAQIAAVFGELPGTPPQVSFAAPVAGPHVRGFTVSATAEDDVRIRDVILEIDGVAFEQPRRLPPYEWVTDEKLALGEHTLELIATDYYGASAASSLGVTAEPECTGKARGCDSGQLCLEGRCIAGPSQAGGLGERCAGNADCASGACAAAGNEQHCVEECALGGDTCPEEFRCLASAGGGGVCWPDDDEGGCAAGSGSAPLGLGVGLGLAALALRPRRRGRRAQRGQRAQRGGRGES